MLSVARSVASQTADGPAFDIEAQVANEPAVDIEARHTAVRRRCPAVFARMCRDGGATSIKRSRLHDFTLGTPLSYAKHALVAKLTAAAREHAAKRHTMATASFRLTNRCARSLVFPQIIVPPASEGVSGSVNLVIFGVDSVEDWSTLDRSFEAFKAAIDAGDLVVERTTWLKLKNTSARAVRFQGRETGFTVPPASEAPNGVELALNETERNVLERALSTPTIQRLIAAGDFVVDDIEPQPQWSVSA